MIIVKTPYRISFFGGGTDYHTWYQQNGGTVISTTINHYSNILCRYLPPFKEFRYRIAWKIMELVNNIDEITHPAIKAILSEYINDGKCLELLCSSDLPARSGLGSSSAFTVAMLKCVYALKGSYISKQELAKQAIRIERDVLKENVGIQDQIACSYGGLNIVNIERNGDFFVEPVAISERRKKLFNSHLLLFYTGISRTASEIAGDQMQKAKDNASQLIEMQKMPDEALKILVNENADIKELGNLLAHAWKLKSSLDGKVSNSFIDQIYNAGVKNGAIGGKLLGAGGGGFFLFFAEPQYHEQIINALSSLLYVPFEFESLGAHLTHYQMHDYNEETYKRRDYIHLKKAS